MQEQGYYTLVPGTATGDAPWTNIPISFYGGVNSKTGEVSDRQHPLC